MSVELIKKSGNRYVLQVALELDSESMLSSEDQIQKSVSDLGKLATSLALEQFDTKGEPIVNGIDKRTYCQRWYSVLSCVIYGCFLEVNLNF